MPRIAYFFGVLIVMHFLSAEHAPPHIHAFYGEQEAKFRISDGEMFEGFIPNKQRNAVTKFIKDFQNELQEMWDKERYQKIKVKG